MARAPTDRGPDDIIAQLADLDVAQLGRVITAAQLGRVITAAQDQRVAKIAEARAP
jgi:hypothetical protein